MARKTAFLILFAWLGTSATAHDMWLESSSFMTFPGEKVTIRNGSGTIFQKSENALAPDRIAALLGLDPDGKKFGPGTPYVDGNWLNLDFHPEKYGNYWIALASRPRKIALSGADFNNYLEHDGIPGVLEQRKEKGILDRDEVEEYSKHVKIYLQSGKKRSRNQSRVLGLKIEIVPLKNPYVLQAGDSLPVRVFYGGRPLAGLDLHAGSDSRFSEASHQVTGSDGKAVIPLSTSGRWYIRGIHLFQVDEQDHSYESYWATLTFEVGGL